MDLSKAHAALKQAITKSYAPYSNFAVAAVVEGESGALYLGANMENAAYPQGWCAEASALAAMVMAGETKAVSVAVMGSGPIDCTPCGGCRQKLREFMTLEGEIHIFDPDQHRATHSLAALLPHSFGPDNLA